MVTVIWGTFTEYSNPHTEGMTLTLILLHNLFVESTLGMNYILFCALSFCLYIHVKLTNSNWYSTVFVQYYSMRITTQSFSNSNSALKLYCLVTSKQYFHFKITYRVSFSTVKKSNIDNLANNDLVVEDNYCTEKHCKLPTANVGCYYHILECKNLYWLWNENLPVVHFLTFKFTALESSCT